MRGIINLSDHEWEGSLILAIMNERDKNCWKFIIELHKDVRTLTAKG